MIGWRGALLRLAPRRRGAGRRGLRADRAGLRRGLQGGAHDQLRARGVGDVRRAPGRGSAWRRRRGDGCARARRRGHGGLRVGLQPPGPALAGGPALDRRDHGDPGAGRSDARGGSAPLRGAARHAAAGDPVRAARPVRGSYPRRARGGAGGGDRGHRPGGRLLSLDPHRRGAARARRRSAGRARGGHRRAPAPRDRVGHGGAARGGGRHPLDAGNRRGLRAGAARAQGVPRRRHRRARQRRGEHRGRGGHRRPREPHRRLRGSRARRGFQQRGPVRRCCSACCSCDPMDYSAGRTRGGSRRQEG